MARDFGRELNVRNIRRNLGRNDVLWTYRPESRAVVPVSANALASLIFDESSLGSTTFYDLDVTNDLNVGGNFNITGTTTLSGDLYIPEYIYHAGDTDTYMRFQDNQWTLSAGGVEIVDVTSTTFTVQGLVDSGIFYDTATDRLTFESRAADATIRLVPGAGASYSEISWANGSFSDIAGIYAIENDVAGFYDYAGFDVWKYTFGANKIFDVNPDNEDIDVRFGTGTTGYFFDYDSGLALLAMVADTNHAGDLSIRNAANTSDVVKFYNTNNVSAGPDIEIISSGLISAQASLWVNIDSDNNSSNSFFTVAKDANTSAATKLFTVNEESIVADLQTTIKSEVATEVDSSTTETISIKDQQEINITASGNTLTISDLLEGARIVLRNESSGTANLAHDVILTGTVHSSPVGIPANATWCLIWDATNTRFKF